ncbi:MAG: hypothetical protein H0W90_06770 [Actinobacteria bacterium]|nr:hypothetical protein [Actinomycetota bacterium]
MRSAAAALAALVLLLVAAGCGSSSAATRTSSGSDAASFVPPSALAYVSADANLDSQQWQVVTDLFGPLPSTLDYKNEIKPALGDRVNLAVLGIDSGKPEAIALVKPADQAKLRSLAKKFDQGSEHYTVEQIGGWSVVADSAEAFQAVRNADSGSSLADSAEFKSAMSQVGDSGFATAYASGAGLQQLSAKLQALVRVAGSPRWVAAGIWADKSALQIKARAAGGTSPPPYRPALLHDVPSGAILAVSFKNVNQLLARIQSEPLLRGSMPPFVTGLRSLTGEGVLYLLPGVLLPVMTLEVHPSDPVAAAKALRGVAAKAARMLPLHVERHGKVVLLTNAAPGSSPGSGSLTDDQPFKDALAEADVPAEITWLAYADIQRLAPILQALASLAGNGQYKVNLNLKLDKFQTLVAFGARSGSTGGIEARLTLR